MKKGVKAILLFGLIALTAGSAYLYERALQWEEWKRFGPGPGFTIAHEGGGGMSIEYCHVIQAVVPDAHHNWLWKFSQEPNVLWEDVRIDIGSGDFPHGLSGPAKVGDRVCGLSERDYSVIYYYEPTGDTMWAEYI